MSEIVVFDENNASLSDIVDERVCEFLLKDAHSAVINAIIGVYEAYPGKYELIIKTISISRSGNRENSGLGD